MGNTTAIEWAHATYNPWYGCRKVSAGCKNCYAERDMTKYGKTFAAVQRSKTTFNAPRVWARTGKVAPGSRIFTCSWSDWFIEEADAWRAEAWEIVRGTPQFTYLILTKRPERISPHLPSDWGAGYPNVWLGVSAENQEQANRRVPLLLDLPAAIRFVSAEPLLGPIDFNERELLCQTWRRGATIGTYLDWIITGGESHPSNPRPCDLDWVRSIRDQCQATQTAFFHKQHGGARKMEGTWGGRVLDGRTWDEFPEAKG